MARFIVAFMCVAEGAVSPSGAFLKRPAGTDVSLKNNEHFFIVPSL
ncbi:MAG: hypothetical protein ACOVSW_18220 [Candidatus Kapaibacteriota bacterium]